jgi:hypothetical protein
VQICPNIVYYPKDGSFSFHWKTKRLKPTRCDSWAMYPNTIILIFVLAPLKMNVI